MMVIEGLQSLFVELVSVASNPTIILYILFGAFVGMVFGAIPGITATTAVILMIPVTYYMPLDAALALLLATFKGGMFGGSISSVLLGCPGSPGAVATSLDGISHGATG